jgi:hypothetical protein
VSNDESLEFQKHQMVNPPAAALETYTGSYSSQEMDVNYQIFLQDGGLWMALKKTPPLPLKPAFEDVFQLDASEAMQRPADLIVRFERKNGEISGFRLSEGRALRLSFKKNLK